MAEKELPGHKDKIFIKENKTLEMEKNNDELENAEEIVFDGVFDNLEVDDIYGDLKVDSLNDMNYTELKEKYENSRTEVKSLRKLSDKLKRENEILKNNIVSLYLTAKREIDRKDGELKIYQRKEVNYQLRLSKKEKGKEMEKEQGKGKGSKKINKKHGRLNATIQNTQKTETRYSGDKTELVSSGDKMQHTKDSGGSSARQSHKHSFGNKTEAGWFGDKTEIRSSADKTCSSQDSVDSSVRQSQKHSSGNRSDSIEAKKGHSNKKTMISSRSRHKKDEPGIRGGNPRETKHKSSKRKSMIYKDWKKDSKSGSHSDSSSSQPKRQKINS